MRHIPNILSELRFLGAISLLFCSPISMAFWIIYGLCGISDMADGYMARRLHAESKAGAVLDSVADVSIIPIAIVAGVATFAAIQEGHFIRRSFFSI